MKSKAYGIVVIWSVIILGFLDGLTYNHLRILDSATKNRMQPKGYVPEVCPREIFRGFGDIDSLGELVGSLARLKRERDEALFFVRQLGEVAKEKEVDPDEYIVFRSVGDFYESDTDVEDQQVAKYDVLFRRLEAILGVGDVKEIAGAIFRLKREWHEARDLLCQMSGFAQEKKYTA